MKKRVKEHISLRLDADFMDFLREESERRGIKKNKLMNTIVIKYMQEVKQNELQQTSSHRTTEKIS